ncbi:hypothetical protein K435DRAFT_861858 [Dendrothele bispora CBS 962.96]|uniref:Asl1-like glycosyl hydrolase catalytic domain-containing protein n=1 Tax=Dendrothele bispora (strain CBS 962.96) TaxID=1314807 RepID=A0A4S8LVK4_DENBC|nr:hypothetical protein K435DRAFT_861858 [Dendrothele bispora CBS 962.96]
MTRLAAYFHLSLLGLFCLLIGVSNVHTSRLPRKPASNSRQGVCFASSEISDVTKLSNTQISWLLNWSPIPPDGLPSDIEHVPMQWGAGAAETFESFVLNANATHALGFNEPDLGSQSNLNPTEAASLWKQFIQPLASHGVRLGSPSVTNGPPSSMGTGWLNDFINECNGCTIDFIAIHWYGSGADDFIEYIEQIHAQFPDYPIWITEFADTSPDPAAVQNFLETTTAYMNTAAYIERYAWFAFCRTTNGLNSNLMDTNGNINALGATYGL